MFRRLLNRQNWLERLPGRRNKSRSVRRAALSEEALRQLRMEALEQRALLTASPWQQAALDITGPDGVGKDGPLAIVGLELAQMFRLHEAGQTVDLATAGVGATNLDDNRVVVDVATDGNVADFQAYLAGIGMEVTGVFNNLVSGFLPLDRIDDLAGVPGLRTVQPAAAARGVGVTTTQGDPSMLTDAVRQFLGFNGAGQRVGILSDSFNDLGGAGADVTNGDLPGPGNPNGFLTPVNVLDDTAGGVNSDEGRGMLQLVHDVAPGATLAFHTAFNGQADFAQGILDLQAAGATIIADDVFYFHEPFFMDGVIAQAADQVAAAGIPYFALANNHGRNSYESVYRPSGTVHAPAAFASAAGAPAFAGGESHDFDPGAGVDDLQGFSLANGQTMRLSFQWDNPFFSHTGGVAGATTDMDIYVLNAANVVVAGGTVGNVGGDPVEVFSFTNTTGAAANFNVMLVRFAGPNPTLVKYINLTNGAPDMVGLEFDTNSGTAYGHANANLGMSIGAAFALNTPEFGVSPAIVEGFSSAGGIPTLFNTAGAPIAPVIRQTPDVVGPDGGNTSFFGTDHPADPDTFPNFFGTSAATPHVAALAALIRQANPGITVAQVNDALRNTALDMDDPSTGGFDVGFDFGTGFGYVHGPLAIAAGPATNYPATFDGTAGSDTMLIRRDASGNAEFLLGGVLVFEFPVDQITTITVNGLAGSDTLTVDFSGGDPIPAGGISFAGGESAGDNDRLVATGYNLVTADGTPDVTVNHLGTENGNIVFLGLGTITFSEIEPMALAGNAADLVINLPAGPSTDTVLGDDGFAPDPNGNTANTSAIDAGTFEFTEFTNPTNTLTVNLGAAGDTITLRAMDPAFAPGGAAPQFIVNGGAGADTVNVQATSAGVTTRINAAGGADTVNVSSDAPANTGDLNALNGLLLVNSGDAAGGDVLNISESGLGAADTVTVNTGNAPFQISGTAGGGWAIQEPTNIFSGGINLRLGSAGDTVNAQSTFANEPVNVFAGGGNDVFNVSSNAPTNTGTLNDIDSTLTLDGQAGVNQLHVSNSGNAAADTVTLTSSAMTGTAGGGYTINYTATGGTFGNGVRFDGGSGGNSINVQSTLAGAPTTVNAGGGSDAVTVDSNGGGAGGTVDNIVSLLTVNGQGGATNTLSFEDSSDATADQVAVTPTTVGQGGGDNFFGAGGGVAYTGITTLNVNLGNTQGDTANVIPSATTTYNLNGNNPTVLPGDVLVYNGPSPATKTITGPNSGSITAPGVMPVNFTSFEQLSTPGGQFFHDAIDLTLIPGGQDGNPNLVLVQVDATGTFLDVFVDGNTNDNGGVPNPVQVTRQPLASIQSLAVIGGTDADTLLIQETAGGLPVFPGTAAGSHTNAAFTTSGLQNSAGNQNIGLHFEGAGGADTLRMNFTTPRNVSTFDDDVPGQANSGVVNVQGQFNLSYDGLAPIIAVGAGGLFLADASALAGNTTMTVADDPADTAGAGGDMITGNGGFETRFIRGFTTVIARSGQNGDTLTLAGLDPAGTVTAITLDGDTIGNTDVSPDTLIIQSLPAGVTATMLGGQGNDVFILNSSGVGLPGTSANILGAVSVSPSPADDPAAGDADRLTIVDDANAANRSVTITSTTIEGLTGFGGTPDVTYAQIGTAAHATGAVQILGGSGSDTYNIQSTVVNTNYFVTTDPIVLAAAGNDTVNVSSAAPLLSGNLTGIQGPLFLNTRGNATAAGDTLNVSDQGGVVRTYGLTLIAGNVTQLTATGVANINYDANDLLFPNPQGQLEHFNLIGSDDAGNGDVYNINNTTATVTNVISDGTVAAGAGADNSTFNIQANNLQAGAANTFQGFDGVDVFNANFAANTSVPAAAGTTFQINGGVQPAGAPNRDRVNFNVNAAGEGPAGRVVGMTYASAVSGDVDVVGLGTPTFIDVNTVEQIQYNGDTDANGNNDQLTVNGTAGDDLLSVTPLAPSSANVFLNGTPFLSVNDAAPFNSPATNNPGIAGTVNNTGPDINLNGLVGGAGNGLTMHGGAGGNDRLIVNAPSEATGDGEGGAAGWNATAFGGLGSSIVAAPNAYDVINVDDTRVDIFNPLLGQLARVNISTASFADAATHDVVVNSGGETDPNPALVADDVIVQLSLSLGFQLNGGLPTPPFAVNPLFLRGDRLQLLPLPGGNMNITADAAPDGNTQAAPNVPNVAFWSVNPGGISQPVTPNNFELIVTRPDDANQVVNIFGDNTGPGLVAANQQDEIMVLGGDVDSQLLDPRSDADGQNEFNLLFNGSARIGVFNTRFLNINPLTLDDDVTLDPWADNTVGGWGIDVRTDGGTGNDDVFYGNVERDTTVQPNVIFTDTSPDGSRSGVSENVVLAPTTTAGAGQIRSTNATDGSNVLTADYTNVEDVSFFLNNGSAGDTDSLSLRGTGGADNVAANFTRTGWTLVPAAANAGLVLSAEELININAGGVHVHGMARAQANTNATPTLLALAQVSFALGDGDDVFTFTGRPTAAVANSASAVAPLTVHIDSGTPSASDVINLTGTINADDSYTNTPAGANAGTLQVQLSASPLSIVNYTATETISIHGGGGTGQDILTLHGTGGPNAFTLAGTGTVAGTARVDDGPTITFASFGTGGAGAESSDINLHGLGGDDSFAITHIGNWQIDEIRVDGGAPSASDSAQITGTAAVDAITYTATAANGGVLDMLTGGSTTSYLLTSVEAALVDALAPATAPGDTLVATNASSVLVPGPQPGFGTITAVDVNNNALLPLSYRGIEAASATGAALLVQGTEGNDRVRVTDTGIVEFLDPTGTVVVNSFNASGFGVLILNTLGGDDTVAIHASALFAGGIFVIGGDNGDGSDSITLNGSGNADVIGVNLATGVVTGVVGGPVNATGFEHLTVDGQGGADTVNVTDVGSVSPFQTVAILSGETLNATATTGHDTINVRPTGAGAGTFWSAHGQPLVTYGGATTSFTVTGNGGFDVLHLHGTEGPDTVTTPSATSVQVSGGTVVFADIDRLDISTFGSNDQITLSNGIAIPKIIYAGSGNDTIDASAAAATDPVIYGGDGDDTIVGSPGPDFIYAGAGNDTVNGGLGVDTIYGGTGDDVLIGGGGDDILYGEEGNDRFGDPAVRDPAANDGGNDLFVGGDGSDLFFWDPGDGDDTIEAGAGSADQIHFFGSGGGEQFSLYADLINASRFHLFRNTGSIDVIASDVEEVNLTANGGTDTVSIGRDLVTNTLTNLQTTGVRVINVALGDAAADGVTVEGRQVADSLQASISGGIVTVTGLGYDVRLLGVDANLDGLTLAGNEGDDTLRVGAGVEAAVLLTLNGNAGNDTLDTSATVFNVNAAVTLNGGDGDDLLLGGAGNETMNGGPGDDTFSGGGGTDSVDAGAGLLGDTILVSGTPGADVISASLNAAGHLLITVNGVTTTYTGPAAGAIAGSGVDLLAVQGGLGNDSLIVDSTNGAIPVAIEYYGGGGSDQLTLTGGTATSDIYSPGPNPGQGVSTIVIGGVTQTVTFDGIEPVLDLVAGPLVVEGTPANNAINYTQGGAGNGLVSIDNLETIEFSNKATLTINGLAGHDTINIANPATPLGLNSITVNGDDPGSGDTLVITGTAGADGFEYAPTGGPNAGSVLIAGLPTVNFDTISAVTIDGRSTLNDDTLTIRSEGGFDIVTLTPGATLDSGLVQIKATSGSESTPPLTFLGLGQDATLTLLSGPAGAREDEFEYLGTGASDTFDVTAAGQVTLNRQINVVANGANRLVVRGLEGSDVFNVAGDHPFTNGIRVDGGGPGAGSDVLNMTGAGNVAENVTIQPDANLPREQDIVGFGVSTVDVTGVELITVTAQAADPDTLNVALGDGDNWARVERGSDVGGANADLVTSDSLPNIQFTGESRFRLTAGPGNGAGADVVTFATWFLAGATNTNYEFDGGVSDVLIIEGVDSGLNGNDDFSITNPAGANPLAVSDLHGTLATVTVVNATLGRVQINTLGGDDEVIVNLAALDLVTIPITFDGGTNSDRLTVTGTPNQGATAATYSPGPATGQGHLTHTAGGATMTIDILNLEPVVDLVPGSLTVNGTGAANTIEYRAVGANGLVSVDAFETIEFAGKTTVTLNGGAGNDQFHVAGTNAGFTGTMFINGDGPVLGGDSLTVTGVAATTTVDHAAGTIAGALNAAAQLIDYGTIEQIHVNAGASTRLAMTGSQNYTVNPGAATDQGEVLSGGVPVAFDGFGAAGFIRLTGNGLGRVTVQGTNANDTITVDVLGGFDTVTTAGRATIETAALPTAIVNSLAGDDAFVVNGNAGFTYTQLALNGGDGDDDDSLTANTPPNAVTVDLGAATITGYGPAAMAINYTGLQAIVADAGGAVINVVASAGDDDVTVTPSDANSGVVELGNQAVQAGTVLRPPIDPTLFYLNTAGNAVNVDLAGGRDTLIVVGSTPGNRAALQQQVFDIDLTNARVRIDDQNDAAFDGTVTYLNNESLAVYGLEGDDDFNVTMYTAVLAAGDQRIPLFLDGGDPIGQTAGDRINLNANGNPVIAESGPENDEGGFLVASNARLSYDHIEAATVALAPCAIVVGTNGDDDITIIARNELANPAQFVGADGRQDFTSTVNAGVEILWLDVSDLYIDALSGDDDMVIRAPAPDGVAPALDWDVHVRIVGGPPSGITGDQGDVVILETPDNAAFAADVIYTADGPDTGRLLLDEDNSSTYTAGSTDSLIEILNQFVVDCDNDGVNEYRSSPGGTEQLVFDAEGTNGTFTVFGNPLDLATNDSIVHTPGTAGDEGAFRNANLLGITYQNLGGGATIQVDGRSQVAGGSDVLFAVGTSFSDDFAVAATTSAITVNGRLPLTHVNVEQLSLDGLDGDDTFTVNTPYGASVTDIFVNGQGPGGSDVLNVVSNNAAVEAFAVAMGVFPGSGNVQVNAINNVYSGIEHVVVDGSAADTDNLTVTDDLRDNVWTVSGGSAGDRIQIAGRESLDYVDFNNVTLNNQNGTDSFVVYPTTLTQFAGAFTVNGDAAAPVDDVLTLVGTPGDDTVTSPAVGPVISVNGTQITAGANLTEVRVLTLDGNDNINLDLDLPGAGAVRKVVDAGAGNDIIDMLGSVDADIFGGIGDDTITGSPVADLIFGGPGNDILIGAGGADTIYGEDGNDLFGNPSTTPNGAADDGGNDRFFGGAGSDTFVWEPGDGSDTIEGGSEEADVLLFFGSAGAETFNIFAKLSDPSRAILFRSVGSITMDMAGVDQINVSGGDGVDRYVVGRANDGDAGDDEASTSPYVDPTASLSDLSTTEVRVVNITGAAATGDFVFVDGRPLNDNLLASIESGGTNTVRVAGLPYDVRVLGATTADRLTIRGNEGHDVIKAQSGVEGVIAVTLAGGAGDDQLSADAILIGGLGDDFLEGGAGNDQIFGNQGEDTMIGLGGADTFDGGPDFDTILIPGTSGNDRIDVNQTAAATLVHTVNGVTETDTLVLVAGVRTVERALVQAGDGDDIIRVQWNDSLGQSVVVDSLRMDVEGGDDSTRDRLAVVDDATGDLVLYRKGEFDGTGSMTVGPAEDEPLEAVFQGIEYAEPVSGTNGRVVVFKHDPFEFNNSRFLATHLGADGAINVDPTIDPGADVPFGLPSDQDFYRFEAKYTGTLDLQVFFEELPTLASGRAGLPGDGNLDIRVLDLDGTVIAGTGAFGDDDPTNQNDVNLDGDPFREDERIRIPAVQGQTYYLQVFGVGAAINNYNMTILNVPAPVPFDLELDDNPADSAYDCNAASPSGLNSDTGRSHFDNITCDNTPTIVFRLDDGVLLNDLPGNNMPTTPPDQVIPIPFRTAPTQPTLPGYAIAIFDEGSVSPAPGNGPNVNVRTPLGFATQLEPGLYQFTTPVLLDGSHFLTARVQMIDPATPQQTGFGGRSLSLEIIVDTQDPLASFGVTAVGTDGLHPDSDSGVDGPASPDTYTDRITNDTSPTFYGLAESDSVVRMYLDINQNNLVDAGDVFVGQTTAVPYDGSNQFGNPAFKLDGSVASGQWEITSTVHMNDTEARSLAGLPVVLPFDGLRRFLITAEDVAGNVSAPQVLDIFVDTQGPQVERVFITADPAFDLFDPKVPGGYLIPTPLINSLSIDVRDLPNRILAFVYDALEQVPAIAPGHFLLRGDFNGVIPINGITFISDPQVAGQPRTGTIVLTFAGPLPDDRFTLTILDEVVDPAGNALDGENNAVEPQEDPNFPTGDGQPGHNFVARFTVDSRPEIGVWASGNAWIDTNGNNLFDPDNADFVNRDIVYSFGNGSQVGTDPAITTDDLFAGNFSMPGGPAADGFDKLAAYGATGFGLNGYRWLIDTDNDGVPDINNAEPLGINGLPVAGNFDGNRANGDEVAVYTGSEWYFDTDHNYQLNANSRLASNLQGYPIVGDFDGDGLDDLGTWTDDRFMFDLSSVGVGVGILPGLINGQADRVINFGFIGVRELPVAADMDKDGIDDIGLWVPERNGQAPEEVSEWYFLISGSGALRNGYLPGTDFPGLPAFNRLADAFEPVPFGSDQYAQFGDTYGIGIVGNFDPPVAGTGSAGTNPVDFTNERDPNDVNGDGFVTHMDVLVLVNALNDRRTSTDATVRSGKLFGVTTAPNYLDPNGDTYVSPADALKIINFMNARGPLGGEGEGSAEGEAFGGVAVDDAPAPVPAGKQAAPAAEKLSFSSLVISTTQLGTAAGTQPLYAAIDAGSGTLARQQDQALSDLFPSDTATSTTSLETTEVHEELLGEMGADELSVDLLDELAAVLADDETDRAIQDLFG